jgi:hypothetical protein
MSIGNMAASFASGILPIKIGTRNTVLILCSGYYKNQEILSGVLSTYTVTIMWSATLIARM